MRMKRLLFFSMVWSVIILLHHRIGAMSESTFLARAVQRNQIGRVEELLKANVDLNVQDKDGNTLLMKAAMHGQTDVAMLLIAAGAKLNVRDCYGNTALMKAAAYGNSYIVELLIEAKADLFLQNHLGGTALIEATAFGQIESVKLLIPAMKRAYEERPYTKVYKCDIDTLRCTMISDLIHPLDIRDTFGRTALVWAALGAHTEIVRLLVQAGADQYIRDDDGSSAYQLVQKRKLKNAGQILAALDNVANAEISGGQIVNALRPKKRRR
jgi:ankyrin repeat protein